MPTVVEQLKQGADDAFRRDQKQPLRLAERFPPVDRGPAVGNPNDQGTDHTDHGEDQQGLIEERLRVERQVQIPPNATISLILEWANS